MPPETTEIDPVKYGVLWQKVQDMDKKMDKMEDQIDQLLELANRSNGGLWAGMAIASMAGGAFSWILTHFKVS